MSNYVYAIVNKINLKLYFGSHSWEGEGPDPNYYGSGKIIKQAVKKYGKDNFIVYPIKFYDTIEECRSAEQELLTKYDIKNNPYCYNVKNSAIGWDKGKSLSEETRQKISQAMKGKTVSEETRKKISQGNKGKTVTISEEHRKKISQAMKGKTVSEETRKKMSQSKKNLMTPVVAIQKDTGKVKIFESQIECTRVLGLHPGNVNRCLKGMRKTCKGYTFKYIEQLESGIYEGIL